MCKVAGVSPITNSTLPSVDARLVRSYREGMFPARHGTRWYLSSARMPAMATTCGSK